MEPRVSVALCSYNGARYIGEQLASIVGQTQPPTELVISDDGSTDDTVKQARIFLESLPAAVRPQVTIIENDTQLGVTRNFEQAIAATTGDLVALSDQDDVWYPNRLARLVERFQEDPSLHLVGSGADAIDEEGQPLGFTLFSAIGVSDAEWAQVESGRAYEALLRRNLFTGATMLFRRSLFEMARPFPDHWLHDEWLAIVAAAVGEVQLRRESLTGYRQHGANHAGVKEQHLLNRVRKVRKLFAPRSNSNRTLLTRATQLVAHLEGLGGRVDSEDLEKARENLMHERHRSDLPKVRPLRVRPVLREMRTGRYDLYDYGVKDAVRDLLQSAR